MLSLFNDFTNYFSIRFRVVFCFLSALVVTLGLGLFALVRLGSVNDLAAEIRNHWLPATAYVGEIARETERYRALEAQLLRASTESERGAAEHSLEAVRASLAKARADYQRVATAARIASRLCSAAPRSLSPLACSSCASSAR